MKQGVPDVISILSRERTEIALLDPDSAGYDEAVRRLDELERSVLGDTQSADDDERDLRRVVAIRIGTGGDEAHGAVRGGGRETPVW